MLLDQENPDRMDSSKIASCSGLWTVLPTHMRKSRKITATRSRWKSVFIFFGSVKSHVSLRHPTSNWYRQGNPPLLDQGFSKSFYRLILFGVSKMTPRHHRCLSKRTINFNQLLVVLGYHIPERHHFGWWNLNIAAQIISISHCTPFSQ